MTLTKLWHFSEVLAHKKTPSWRTFGVCKGEINNSGRWNFNTTSWLEKWRNEDKQRRKKTPISGRRLLNLPRQIRKEPAWRAVPAQTTHLDPRALPPPPSPPGPLCQHDTWPTYGGTKPIQHVHPAHLRVWRQDDLVRCKAGKQSHWGSFSWAWLKCVSGIRYLVDPKDFAFSLTLEWDSRTDL